MKTIGYLLGTDPEFLSKMVCMGYSTLPLGNGVDSHGKYLGFITIADNIDLIVGHIHKVSPHESFSITVNNLLNPGILHEIPMLLIAPKENIEDAKKIISKATSSKHIKVIAPEKLIDEAIKILR